MLPQQTLIVYSTCITITINNDDNLSMCSGTSQHDVVLGFS